MFEVIIHNSATDQPVKFHSGYDAREFYHVLKQAGWNVSLVVPGVC